MKLLATSLFVLLAVALSDSIGNECKDIKLLHEKSDNKKFDDIYRLEGKCDGGDDPVTTKIDLNPCIFNDNGRLNWGKNKYVPPSP